MQKTLNGYEVSKLPEILDQPLPPTAYKKIPGGPNLTDIDANWQKRAFNKIFGVYGIGWGFDFDPANMDIRHELNENDKRQILVRVIGTFWFKYTDGKEVLTASYPVTGGNSSFTGQEAYCMKGAITNAIGFGAAMIGWQESVYLGARSHTNTTGFAPGKTFVEYNDPKSEDTVVLKKGDSPSIDALESRHYVCQSCGRSGDSPGGCKCGEGKVKPVTKPVAKPAEKPAPEPDPAPESDPEPPTPVAPENSSLAEKVGFESIKHAVCVQCGYCEPVNELPPACPSCGVVAKESFTVAPSHAEMLKMSSNIKAKLDLANTAANHKQVLEELKACHSSDRRLILQSLTDAAGRTIRNYSEASIQDIQKAIAMSKAAGDTKPANDEPIPQGKTELARAVFDLARVIGCRTPGQIIAEIGKTAGKEIRSASQLNEEELLAVYKNFKERK